MKKLIIGGSIVGAWFTINIIFMHKTGVMDRIREMDAKYNGKIPFNAKTFDYIFAGPVKYGPVK